MMSSVCLFPGLFAFTSGISASTSSLVHILSDLSLHVSEIVESEENMSLKTATNSLHFSWVLLSQCAHNCVIEMAALVSAKSTGSWEPRLERV